MTVRKSSLMILLIAGMWFLSNGGLFRFGPVNPPLWLIAYLSFLSWATTNYGQAKRMITMHLPILMIPCIAILSTAWSISPGRSLFAGIQMMMTVLIALSIRELFTTLQIFTALAISQLTGFVLSLANLAVGFLPPVYELNGALLGIYSHKTGLGKAAFWGAFAVVAICALRRIPYVGLIVMVITFPFTRLAMSTTASLGYAFIVLMIVLINVRRTHLSFRYYVLFAPAILVVSYAVAYIATGGDLLGDTLAALGKNSNLTGRTVLWAIGLEIWSDNPLLGIGFQSFWNSPQYADVVHWIWAYVDDGLNGFHNAYVEALVGLGLFGFIPFVSVLIYTGFSLFRWYMEERSIEAAIWLCAFLAPSILATMEDTFFKMHTAHFMMAVMAFSTAVQRNRKRQK